MRAARVVRQPAYAIVGHTLQRNDDKRIAQLTTDTRVCTCYSKWLRLSLLFCSPQAMMYDETTRHPIHAGLAFAGEHSPFALAFIKFVRSRQEDGAKQKPWADRSS